VRIAVDYSSGTLTGDRLLDHGVSGAIRYVGFPNRPKCTSSVELARLVNAQRGVAFVFEDGTRDWTGGQSAGKRNGELARNHLNQMKLDKSIACYIAIDQYIASRDEFELVRGYLTGAAIALGGVEHVGVYGSANVLDFARENRLANYFWQTIAWSHGRVAQCDLLQTGETIVIDGVECDINEIRSPQWGQIGGPVMDIPTDLIADTGFRLDSFLQEKVNQEGGPSVGEYFPLVQDLLALFWRVEALISMSETVKDGPRTGEVNQVAVELRKLRDAVAALHPTGSGGSEASDRVADTHPGDLQTN